MSSQTLDIVAVERIHFLEALQTLAPGVLEWPLDKTTFWLRPEIKSCIKASTV